MSLRQNANAQGILTLAASGWTYELLFDVRASFGGSPVNSPGG